ncbi:hypothetical protein QJQ45_010072 [Haematococcus lacustris]|nr:hypothetical protein QJQ45_010072 [Haematococcus lacustris]
MSQPPLSQLPQFYFPNALQVSEARAAEFASRVRKHYEAQPSGLDLDQFTSMVNEAGDLPTTVGRALFWRLGGPEAKTVQQDTFLSWWHARCLLPAPTIKRVFEVLRQEHQEQQASVLSVTDDVESLPVPLLPVGPFDLYLTYEDFSPVLDMLLRHHPGLEFLAGTAEFQKKYAETVVYRIFYTLNKSGNGRLTMRELRRSDLVEALEALDQEDDINKVLKYFSYEHFYVIYCKFWELDTDHDFLVSRKDLAHYSQGALSFQIVDRIFQQVGRSMEPGKVCGAGPDLFIRRCYPACYDTSLAWFTSSVPDMMSYEDFVWFILSEEDKSSDTALDYWFNSGYIMRHRCVDLDCDGVIRPKEMWFFYEEQLKRMEGNNQEAVMFPDVLCQLHDMLQPEVEGQYTLRDLKRMKPQSGLLFNALFNLHKFLNFENRDPFAVRAEQQGELAGLSDWEKFAKIQYYRLASEDENQEVQMEADEQAWGEADAQMADAGDPKRPGA